MCWDAGASLVIDMAQLIAANKPDSDGNTVPADVHEGSAMFASTAGPHEIVNLVVGGDEYNIETAICCNLCPCCDGVVCYDVSPSSANLPDGDICQLYATVYWEDGSHPDVTGNGNTAWVSSNTSVATVSGTLNARDVTATDNAAGIHGTANVYLWFETGMDVERWMNCGDTSCKHDGSYCYTTACDANGFSSPTAFVSLTGPASTICNLGVLVVATSGSSASTTVQDRGPAAGGGAATRTGIRAPFRSWVVASRTSSRRVSASATGATARRHSAVGRFSGGSNKWHASLRPLPLP